MNDLIKNLTHIMNHRKMLDNASFSELMGQILAAFPDIGWELGVPPDDNRIDLLSLAVGNNNNVATELQQGLCTPIFGDDWKIDIGIPPRAWELYFEIQGDDGNTYRINGLDWLWLAKWDLGSVKLTCYVPKHQLFETEESVKIALTGELGELNFAQYISELIIEPLANPTKEMQPMGKFRSEFARHFPSCNYAEFLLTHETTSKSTTPI